MKLDCVYIETKDFEKSIEFYKNILQLKPNVYTEGRYVEFDVDGGRISLYNRKFDEEKLRNLNESFMNFNQAYIDDFKRFSEERKLNNIVVFNFYVDDLKKEYERIKKIAGKSVSEIKYVNIAAPYYYFTVEDPEGNVLEIYSNSFDDM